jgi:NADH-quinone oxidoreductase subunit C
MSTPTDDVAVSPRATATAADVPAPGRGTRGTALALDELAERVTARFPEVTTDVAGGELVVHAPAEHLVAILTFCREDDELACEMLADLSGVHWPAGEHVVDRQRSTTGWPTYRVSRDEGRIEVLYTVRSIARNHWLRIAVATDDTDPRLPSATGVYPTANFHEREVYDLFGIVFDGHPDLTRILLPDDWVGHPHRKDHPLGGVDISYANDRVIVPPEERDLREVVR